MRTETTPAAAKVRAAVWRISRTSCTSIYTVTELTSIIIIITTTCSKHSSNTINSNNSNIRLNYCIPSIINTTNNNTTI